MTNCPVSPQASGQYDLRSATSCAERLRMILAAYETVISGTQRTVIRHNERWVEYNKGNAAELLNYYKAVYAQCPDAARLGLPDMSAGARARRGSPARNAHVC